MQNILEETKRIRESVKANEEVITLMKRIETLEEKLRSAEVSRDTYKRLYEAERSVKDGCVALRDHDKTKLFEICSYISEVLGRWEYLDKTDGQQ